MSTLKEQTAHLLELAESLKKKDTHYTPQDYGGIEVYQYSKEYDKLQSYFRTSDLLIDFSWMSWTKEANTYVDKPEKLKKASLKTVRQLLTAHVKNEALQDGHLAQIIDNGHLFLILDRLKVLHDEMS